MPSTATNKLAPLLADEPINIRAENVARIESHAASLGIRLRTEVFATRESWRDYAVNALQTVEQLATEAGVAQQIHLWPDKSLGTETSRIHLRVLHSGYRTEGSHQGWSNTEKCYLCHARQVRALPMGELGHHFRELVKWSYESEGMG